MIDNNVDLEFRRKLCVAILGILRNMEDPRAPEAIREYEKQLCEIDAQMKRQVPPPIVVGLKTAKLFGEVNNKEM